MKTMPTVSVVIPCYNQGKFLTECVSSVEAQTLRDWEIIVVDDGSTDTETVRAISKLSSSRTRTLRIPNQGLASARNVGIGQSRGRYVLPLDADDRIGSTYLEKAASILDSDPAIGIVYCHAEFFGAATGRWELPPYAFPEILVRPVIFASSLFRRSDWERVGGYSAEMDRGWEDYDFWLSLIERGVQVYRIPEVLFFYRQHAGSMLETLNRGDYVYLFEKLFSRHQDLYLKNMGAIFQEIVNHWEVPPRRPPRGKFGRSLEIAARLGGRIYRRLGKLAE